MQVSNSVSLGVGQTSPPAYLRTKEKFILQVNRIRFELEKNRHEDFHSNHEESEIGWKSRTFYHNSDKIIYGIK